jgi:hypothetical protein
METHLCLPLTFGSSRRQISPPPRRHRRHPQWHAPVHPGRRRGSIGERSFGVGGCGGTAPRRRQAAKDLDEGGGRRILSGERGEGGKGRGFTSMWLNSADSNFKYDVEFSQRLVGSDNHYPLTADVDMGLIYPQPINIIHNNVAGLAKTCRRRGGRHSELPVNGRRKLQILSGSHSLSRNDSQSLACGVIRRPLVPVWWHVPGQRGPPCGGSRARCGSEAAAAPCPAAPSASSASAAQFDRRSTAARNSESRRQNNDPASNRDHLRHLSRRSVFTFPP